jgi:ribosomal protein S24E
MPRKKKTREEKARLIEKPAISQEELNTLEQRLEGDEEDINASELKEFLAEPKKGRKSKLSSSPSLEKVNDLQRIPTRLESNLLENSTTIGNSNGEEDPFKYASGGGKQGGGEAKYIKYEGMMIENITPHKEIQNIGRGNSILERREVQFENSPQARISAQETFEKYTPVKRVDREKLGKENPLLQRKEIKYTPERY